MTGMVRKRRWPLIALAVILIILGFSVLLYPLYTDWQYKNDVKIQKKIFEQKIEDREEELPYEELYQELKRRKL